MRTFAPLTLAATLALAPLAARAQQAPPLELTRLSGPIEVDGVPNEPAWAAVTPLPLTMYTPVFRGSPTQRSEIRVAYDDEYFYAAGWFYDTDPKGIRVNSLYRDRWNGDDALAIYIDAFNDDRNAKWFGTTAAGMRFDQLISDDGATLNGSWDGFWIARTTMTADGWFVEVRIPFSTLGFRVDAEGKTTMGLTVTRLISRLDERVTFPEIDPKFEFRRPSLMRDVVLRDVRTRKPLYFTPWVLSGASRRAVALLPGFGTDRATANEVGLDFRSPLSSNLTLDLTYNTDFAQVEADDQQVNLDRFPLFFPERRRFFQEESGIFDFTGGGNSRLFNSRRIGLSAAGTPVPVVGGARLVGRAGGWDLGLLAMRTAEEGATPDEDFGVLRLRRPILNQWSTAGLMLTALDGVTSNVAAGADASVRIAGDQYLSLKWAASSDSSDPVGSPLSARSQLDLGIERRTGRGMQYGVAATRSGADYHPGLGFTQRRDFSSLNAFGNYYIFTDRHPRLRRIYPGFVAFQTWRNTDGSLESGTWATWVQWETKRGGGGWIEPKWFREDVRVAFPIGSEITIPVGTHDFMDWQFVWTMPTGSRLRTNVDARAGSYFDGSRRQVILRPTWNASKHLELGLDYQFTSLRFPSRGEADDISVARLRVRTALDARLSGNAFVQYNSTTEGLDLNVRLRYAFAEGTDLWLVYNEGLDTERGPDGLGGESPYSLSRSLIVKYSHTFTR
jgi:hypothetical protein